jgi:hypothetical protein
MGSEDLRRGFAVLEPPLDEADLIEAVTVNTTCSSVTCREL